MCKRDASEVIGALTCGRGAPVIPTGAPVRSIGARSLYYYYIGVSACEERRIVAYIGGAYLHVKKGSLGKRLSRLC